MMVPSQSFGLGTDTDPLTGDYVTRQEFNDFMAHLAMAYRELAEEIDPEIG